jgi:hypothetical protein
VVCCLKVVSIGVLAVGMRNSAAECEGDVGRYRRYDEIICTAHDLI